MYAILVLLSFTILMHLLVFNLLHSCSGRLKNAFVVVAMSLHAASDYQGVNLGEGRLLRYWVVRFTVIVPLRVGSSWC